MSCSYNNELNSNWGTHVLHGCTSTFTLIARAHNWTLRVLHVTNRFSTFAFSAANCKAAWAIHFNELNGSSKKWLTEVLYFDIEAVKCFTTKKYRRSQWEPLLKSHSTFPSWWSVQYEVTVYLPCGHVPHLKDFPSAPRWEKRDTCRDYPWCHFWVYSSTAVRAHEAVFTELNIWIIFTMF